MSDDLVKQNIGAVVVTGLERALADRIEALTAERDRQYDENVHRIAMQAKAEAERDALQADSARLREALRAIQTHEQGYAPELRAIARAALNPGKEVMPRETRSARPAHDIGPGDQAVAGAAPWPEGLVHLTGDRMFLRCATEGCGRHVSTRFESNGIRSHYCEPCGRRVAALAQKGGA